MRMTSVSDESMMTNNSVDSPSVDDANVEGEVGGNIPLKKGPWTSAEDAILVEYVTKHGEGNWNAVQKYSGLARCGKSCRLRWANHLRPNLRKGAFTPEEERRIIELHAKMGNKWARMAAELPGRTDNEIKNYWNTRIKRRQRAGLPIYPPDLCSQSLNDNQHSDNMNNFSSGGVHHQDSMPINNFEIPAVEFKILELNDHLYTPPLLDFPAGAFLNFPASSLHGQGLNSSYPNKSLLSSVHPSKRPRGSESYFPRCLQGSESPFPGLNIPICNSYTGRSQYQTDIPVQIAKSMMFSSSEPTWAMELELPSFQNHIATLGSPSPSSPLPFYDSVDILIQTPPNEHVQSCNLSPQNSGLLDAVLYESETVKNSKSNGFSQMDSSHVVNEMEWGAYNEQLSPLGYSSSSVLSESTPISGTSLDEPPYSAGTLPESNCGQVQYDDKVERNNETIFFRPDLLLASDCYGAMEHPNKDLSSLNNAIGTLLGDDLSRDCKKIDEDATLPTQGHACDSDAWNAMPTV